MIQLSKNIYESYRERGYFLDIELVREFISKCVKELSSDNSKFSGVIQFKIENTGQLTLHILYHGDGQIHIFRNCCHKCLVGQPPSKTTVNITDYYEMI